MNPEGKESGSTRFSRLPCGASRTGPAALLDKLCGDDSELRNEVERLVADDERPSWDHLLTNPCAAGPGPEEGSPARAPRSARPRRPHPLPPLPKPHRTGRPDRRRCRLPCLRLVVPTGAGQSTGILGPAQGPSPAGPFRVDRGRRAGPSAPSTRPATRSSTASWPSRSRRGSRSRTRTGPVPAEARSVASEATRRSCRSTRSASTRPCPTSSATLSGASPSRTSDAARPAP